MSQISIFDKKKNFSDKDVTITVGKGDFIYITFRNYSWKLFTESDYVRVFAENGQIKMKDGLSTQFNDKGGRIMKLYINEYSKKTDTRYLKLNGRLMPDVLALCENMNGRSYNFPAKVDYKPTKEEVTRSSEFNEKVHRFRSKVGERVTSEELAADFRPKIEEMKTVVADTKALIMQPTKIVEPIEGFIEVTGIHNERIFLKVDTIYKVCEVMPESRFTPSYLLDQKMKSKTVIFTSDGIICACEPYEDVVGKIRMSLQGGPET